MTLPILPALGLQSLEPLLNLTVVEDRLFEATVHDENLNGRVFGGQLLAQSSLAARLSYPALQLASLQGLFLQGARTDQPLRYQVSALQQGRRFTRVLVNAHQGARHILSAHISLQAQLQGFEHALAADHWPGPESLLPMAQLPHGDWGRFEKPMIELRLIQPHRALRQTAAEPEAAYWVRLRDPLPDDPLKQDAALSYLSDFWINSAAIGHHLPLEQAREHLFVSSLNHTLWFHQPCRADQWLLFVTQSTRAHGGRALTHARVYDHARRFVASVSQDCLMGPREQ